MNPIVLLPISAENVAFTDALLALEGPVGEQTIEVDLGDGPVCRHFRYGEGCNLWFSDFVEVKCLNEDLNRWLFQIAVSQSEEGEPLRLVGKLWDDENLDDENRSANGCALVKAPGSEERSVLGTYLPVNSSLKVAVVVYPLESWEPLAELLDQCKILLKTAHMPGAWSESRWREEVLGMREVLDHLGYEQTCNNIIADTLQEFTTQQELEDLLERAGITPVSCNATNHGPARVVLPRDPKSLVLAAQMLPRTIRQGEIDVTYSFADDPVGIGGKTAESAPEPQDQKEGGANPVEPPRSPGW